MIAGAEAERTNELLQMIATAIIKKVLNQKIAHIVAYIVPCMLLHSYIEQELNHDIFVSVFLRYIHMYVNPYSLCVCDGSVELPCTYAQSWS